MATSAHIDQSVRGFPAALPGAGLNRCWQRDSDVSSTSPQSNMSVKVSHRDSSRPSSALSKLWPLRWVTFLYLTDSVSGQSKPSLHIPSFTVCISLQSDSEARGFVSYSNEEVVTGIIIADNYIALSAARHGGGGGHSDTRARAPARTH